MAPPTRRWRSLTAVAGASAIGVLLVVRVTSLVGLTEVRFPIAVGKTLGWVGLALLLPVLPRLMRPVAWVWLTGGALNLLAMSLTGWLMPVWKHAIAWSGMPDMVGRVPGYAYAQTWPQLVLGDSIPLPWPGTVVSVGDLVLVAGAIWLFRVLLSPAAVSQDRPEVETA